MRSYWISLKTSGSGNGVMNITLRSIILVCLLLSQVMLVGFGWAADQDSVEDLLEMADPAVSRQEVSEQKSIDQQVSIEKKADQLTHEYKMTQARYKLYQCILLAGFALISLVILMRAMCSKENCSAAYMVNASGLVFIIFGTLFLVLLADVDEQLNAGVGILGAVAGYLFGTMRKMEPEEKPPAAKS